MQPAGQGAGGPDFLPEPEERGPGPVRLFDLTEELRKWIKSVILIKPEKIT